MAAQAIGLNLAYINWTVLVALSVGAFGTAVLLRMRTPATKGFLGFTATSALLLGLLAFLSDVNLPAAPGDSPVAADAAFDPVRRGALAGYLVAVAVTTWILYRARRVERVGLLGVGLALAVLVLAALTWGGPFPGLGPVVLLVQLLLLSAATGGVFAAMILGHWYLVTPKLPEAPLILLSRILMAVVAAQLVFFVACVGLGISAPDLDLDPLEALVGPQALFVWLRLVIGLVFPLVVSWMALQTTRTRSMESSTGLHYINVGVISAGTIVAAGLYFGAGLFV
ncbi:MAG TPA: hypothetical protein VLA23_13460 [Candidatus Limnocylindrales bacterium]|nr:hypothetical protein [Candidatus Limnocylindrales bacterium]